MNDPTTYELVCSRCDTAHRAVYDGDLSFYDCINAWCEWCKSTEPHGLTRIDTDSSEESENMRDDEHPVKAKCDDCQRYFMIGCKSDHATVVNTKPCPKCGSDEMHDIVEHRPGQILTKDGREVLLDDHVTVVDQVVLEKVQLRWKDIRQLIDAPDNSELISVTCERDGHDGLINIDFRTDVRDHDES